MFLIESSCGKSLTQQVEDMFYEAVPDVRPYNSFLGSVEIVTALGDRHGLSPMKSFKEDFRPLREANMPHGFNGSRWWGYISYKSS